MRLRRALGLAVLALVATAGQAEGQGPPRDSVPVARTVSAGGAFVRALLLPGWGHAALGSYNRAGFYFGVESLTAYGILRTQVRLREARHRLVFRENVLREDLAAQGIVDPQEVETALQEDAVVADLRGLVEAREGQREDLLAFGIFLVFLSGVDAYVSGHLADFPEPLTVGTGEGPGGGVDVALRLRLPR